MSKISVNISQAAAVAPEATVKALLPEAADALAKVMNGTGAGNDFLGWTDLPTRTPAAELDDIIATAKRLQADCEYVVCVGIGGSYLGAKAVIEGPPCRSA